MRKAVLPKLRSLLRHGCHGSAATSFPALLPLLALLPASLLGPSPDLPAAILESTWLGVEAELQLSQQPGGGLAIQGPGAGSAGPAGRGAAAGGAGGRSGMPAAAEAYQECLAWLLGQAERLAASPTDGAEGGKSGAVETGGGGGGAAAAAGPVSGAGAARGYCEQLLQSTLVPQVLPLVLPTAQGQGQVGGASQAVKDVALQLLAGCTGKVLAAAAAAASPACGGVFAADREGPSPGAAALEACLEAAVSAAAGIVAGAPPPAADPSAAAAQAAPAAAEAAAAAAAAAIESLLQRLKSVPPSTPTLGAALAARLAGAATRQLLTALDAARAGDRPELPAAASSLLARLVRGFGAGMSAGK